MSDIDLDAIRAQVAEALCVRTWGHDGDGVPCAACRKEAAILAGTFFAPLLSRLAEVEAERDDWRAGMTRALKDRQAVEAEMDDRVIALAAQRNVLADRADRLTAENARLRQQLAEDQTRAGQAWDNLVRERDEWRDGMHRALKDREAVEAEMDRRLAEAWRERDAAIEFVDAARSAFGQLGIAFDKFDDARPKVDPLVAALVEAGQTTGEGSGAEAFGIDHPTHPGYWIEVDPSGWPHRRIPVTPGFRLLWVPWLGSGPVPTFKPQRGAS